MLLSEGRGPGLRPDLGPRHEQEDGQDKDRPASQEEHTAHLQEDAHLR